MPRFQKSPSHPFKSPSEASVHIAAMFTTPPTPHIDPAQKSLRCRSHVKDLSIGTEIASFDGRWIVRSACLLELGMAVHRRCYRFGTIVSMMLKSPTHRLILTCFDCKHSSPCCHGQEIPHENPSSSPLTSQAPSSPPPISIPQTTQSSPHPPNLRICTLVTSWP